MESIKAFTQFPNDVAWIVNQKSVQWRTFHLAFSLSQCAIAYFGVLRPGFRHESIDYAIIIEFDIGFWVEKKIPFHSVVFFHRTQL